ncbi:response regulator [bacterium]|nr:response regulator [bacterium]MCP5461602.1 response regulator [bacterium]
MKFIVIDDSSTMRRIICNTLERLGYDDVIEAENGLEALGKLRDIDVIFTDWNMPEMDGLTFVKSVRASQSFSTIPIIMITTESGKPDIIEALEAGVNNYIVKPFTPEILREKIEKVLRK